MATFRRVVLLRCVFFRHELISLLGAHFLQQSISLRLLLRSIHFEELRKLRDKKMRRGDQQDIHTDY
jgi:hypothetical protein